METLIRGFGRWLVSRNEVREVFGNILSSEPSVQVELSHTCSKRKIVQNGDRRRVCIPVGISPTLSTETEAVASAGIFSLLYYKTHLGCRNIKMHRGVQI